MKTFLSVKMISACLTALLLLSEGVATTLRAAGPPLQGQVTLRPLTLTEINVYALTGVQGASGLTTIGLGQPAYLEALVNNAVPNADITNVIWVLSAKPNGSAAVLTSSPLGMNIPTFKVADRINPSGAAVYKVASRSMLRPDVTGTYTVSVTVQTANSGSTNLTQTITIRIPLRSMAALTMSRRRMAGPFPTRWSAAIGQPVRQRSRILPTFNASIAMARAANTPSGN